MRPILDYLTKVATTKTATVNVSEPECIGWSQGQTDLIVRAWDGTQVGSLRYCTYQDEVHVQNIEVDPEYRRQGLATTMWSKMVAAHPGMAINPGMFTDDGSAWWRSMTPQQRGKTSSLHEAGPGSGVIPLRVRAEPPANPRRPRPVVVDRVAAQDIRDLPDGDEKKVNQTIKRIERGEVELERKQRPPLQDCFSADVGRDGLRILLFPHTDGAWHVFYAGYHDYAEAERRMERAASIETTAMPWTEGPDVATRCTEAVLMQFGIFGEVPINGMDVLQAFRSNGWTYRFLYGVEGMSVKQFYDEHPKGKFYLTTSRHAMALVDGLLTDTAGRGPDTRRKLKAVYEVYRPGDTPVAAGRPSLLASTAASSGCRYQHPEGIEAAERMLERAKDQPKESRREHMRSIATGAMRNILKAMETCPDCSDSPVMTAAKGDSINYEVDLSPDGGRVSAVFANDGFRVGYLDWTFPKLRSWKGRAAISNIEVLPEYRRQEMLQRARAAVPYPIEHSPVLSPDGEAWSQKVGATPAVTITHAERTEDDGYDEENSIYTVHTFTASISGQKAGTLVVQGGYDGEWHVDDVVVTEQYRRQGIATALLTHARAMLGVIHHSEWLTDDGRAWSQRVGALRMVHHDSGKYGRRDHMTYEEQGTIPVEVVRNMPGQAREVPGDHRNRKGQRWEDFKADLSHNGMRNGIFIIVSVGEPIRIWEGNHRRDAAVELEWDEVPVQIRYFGLAEQDGLLMERFAKGGNWMDGYADTERIAEEERKRNERWGVRAVTSTEHTAADYYDIVTIDGVDYSVLRRKKPKITALVNGKAVGTLEMRPRSWGGEGYEIEWVFVNDAHKRKGIATNMLQVARDSFGTVLHSSDLTDDGEAWSEKVGAKWNGSTDTEEQVRAWLAEVVHKDYPRGAGGCMVAAQVIAKDMGWPAVDGVFYEGPSIEHAIGAEKVYSHWWNVMPNGDIFDGTAGQFHPSGDIIRIVKRSDPDYKRYLSWQPGRSQWWDRLTKDQQEELDNVTQYAYPHFGSKTAALSTEGMEILMAAIESREPVEVIYWSQPGWAMTSKGTVVGGTSTSINLSNWPDKDIAWADIISVKPADMAVAASSWRPFVAEAYWDAHDVTISSDGGASGRKAYEIHVGGKPWANRPSLTEAKAAVEDEYGPQDWKTVRTDKVAVEHYTLGLTTEFTAPTTIWAADFT